MADLPNDIVDNKDSLNLNNMGTDKNDNVDVSKVNPIYASLDDDALYVSDVHDDMFNDYHLVSTEDSDNSCTLDKVVLNNSTVDEQVMKNGVVCESDMLKNFDVHVTSSSICNGGNISHGSDIIDFPQVTHTCCLANSNSSDDIDCDKLSYNINDNSLTDSLLINSNIECITKCRPKTDKIGRASCRERV